MILFGIVVAAAVAYLMLRKPAPVVQAMPIAPPVIAAPEIPGQPGVHFGLGYTPPIKLTVTPP